MMPCPICSRILGTFLIDEHHLIPKSKKGKETGAIHKVCHRKIHSIFTESQLEHEFNTWEKLKSHDEIKKFISWVKTKPPEFYSGSSDTKKKRKDLQ